MKKIIKAGMYLSLAAMTDRLILTVVTGIWL